METKPANQSDRKTVLLIALGVVVLLAIIGLVVYALLQDAATTAKIRDIFIIFLALESLLIGAALVVLIVQLASLINLVQNELRPIIDSTNETVNTLRGTTRFLSDNLVEPVIKLNAYLAGLQQMTNLFGLKKKKK